MRDEKMNILDYEGFWRCKGHCGLDFIRKDNHCTVVFTYLLDNTGTSVTNIVEVLATKLYNDVLQGEYTPEQIMWVEHYLENKAFELKETWDEVILKWTGEQFKYPEWIPIKKKDKQELKEELITA